MKDYKGQEIKRSWGGAAVGAALMAGALIFAGCSNQTVRDLENVSVTDPDKVRLVVATDQFPNVTAMCIEGAGFATTTRDAAGAILRVEAWDAPNGWCGK